MSSAKKDSSLGTQLLAIGLARLTINITLRMVYSFLPAFSRGLGVPIQSNIRLLSLRSALGISAPVFGMILDRFGPRNTMLGAMIILAAAAAAMALWPVYGIFVVFLLLSVSAYFLFDTSELAYLSERVPYDRRGRIIGAMELAWSGSMLLGMPLVGWLLAQTPTPAAGLSLTFGVLALVCFVSGATLWLVVLRQPESSGNKMNTRYYWKTIFTNRRVMVGLVPGMLIGSASESLNVVFAAWLEDSFGLALTGLGMAMVIIGVAELLGVGGVMLLSDQLGKRRTIALGVGLSIVAYLTLPMLGTTLMGSLIGLFLVYLTFELAIVATLPLITELMPLARPGVLSANILCQSVGRMLGALLGGMLLPLGIGSSGIAAAFINVLALLVLLLWVREHDI